MERRGEQVDLQWSKLFEGHPGVRSRFSHTHNLGVNLWHSLNLSMQLYHKSLAHMYSLRSQLAIMDPEAEEGGPINELPGFRPEDRDGLFDKRKYREALYWSISQVPLRQKGLPLKRK